MGWPADLDPRSLRQPDRVSCGAACMVAARALSTSWRPDDPAAEIRAAHRRLTSSRSARDRFQLPWPRFWGTPPWAVANALTALTGGRIAAVHARPRPAAAHDVLVEHARSRPTAVYVGNRWLPRHVVLAVDAHADGGVEVFDPAAGALVTVAADRWLGHRVDVAGWSHHWFVV